MRELGGLRLLNVSIQARYIAMMIDERSGIAFESSAEESKKLLSSRCRF